MAGNVANFNCIIGNNGTANAGSFTINYYVCSSSSFISPTWIGSDYVSGLVVSSTYSSQISIDLCNAGLANGTYYLGFYIDYSNQVGESNENDNNTFYNSNPYSINCTSGGKPNLYDISGSAGLTGNVALYSYTISNNGTGNAGGFYVNCYACTSPSFTSPILVGSDYVSGLAVGTSYTSEISVDLCNSGLATGSYYLGFYIDYSNQIAESNENDNNTFYSFSATTINCSGSGGGCTYSISPPTGHATFLFGGGSDWTYVTTNNSTCAWTASTPNNWITVLNISGIGNSYINYQVSTNTSPYPRTGTIDVMGLICTIYQDGQNCPVTVNPITDNISNSSGNYSFHMTTGLGCGHSVLTSDPSWLTILSVVGDTLVSDPSWLTIINVVSNTVVNYHVNSNLSSPRIGIITVDTVLHYVNQSGITRLNEISASKEFFIYPNPTDGVINIVGKNFKNDDYKIKIANLLGEIMNEIDFHVSNNIIVKQIDLKQLPSGIYFLNVFTKETMQIFKINKL
ncbi:MAG: CARDB domain-containing protein [Candidatus Paceibacterota bacterium]|jgi:hypothetical protein